MVKFCSDLGHLRLEERVAQIHDHAITQMAQKFEPTLSDIMESRRPKGEYRCQSQEARWLESKAVCDNALLGSLTKELRRRNQVDLTIFKLEKLLHHSIDLCTKLLLGLELTGVETIWWDHDICNPIYALHTSVIAALRNIEAARILTNYHTGYLDSQMQKWLSG